MSNKKIITIGVIILIVAIAVWGVLIFTNNNTKENQNDEIISNSQKNENVTNTNQEEESTDLELHGEPYEPSLVYDSENNQVTLADYSDKPMALFFFNTSESDCDEIMQILQKNYDTYKEKVNFVNITAVDETTETKEKVSEYIETNNITMPVLYDTDYSAKNAYEVDSIPTLVFINKNKEIINTVSKYKNEEIDEDLIQANLDILSENY